MGRSLLLPKPWSARDFRRFWVPGLTYPPLVCPILIQLPHFDCKSDRDLSRLSSSFWREGPADS